MRRLSADVAVLYARTINGALDATINGALVEGSRLQPPIDEVLGRRLAVALDEDPDGISVVFSRKWCCFFPYAFKCIFMHFDAFLTFSLHFIQMHSSPSAWYCILLHLYAFMYDAF
jgi:hypothetical protein